MGRTRRRRSGSGRSRKKKKKNKRKKRKQRKECLANVFFSGRLTVILVGFWERVLVYFFWVRRLEPMYFLVGLE